MAQGSYKYAALTDRIIDCAVEVHKILGYGFPEDIYQRAFAKELFLQDLIFNREYEMPIFYKEELIGTRRVDFLIESMVTVELKAIAKLDEVHLAQAMNYLEAFRLEVGLLINFGARSLEVKRLLNHKLAVKR